MRKVYFYIIFIRKGGQGSKIRGSAKCAILSKEIKSSAKIANGDSAF